MKFFDTFSWFSLCFAPVFGKYNKKAHLALHRWANGLCYSFVSREKFIKPFQNKFRGKRTSVRGTLSQLNTASSSSGRAGSGLSSSPARKASRPMISGAL